MTTTAYAPFLVEKLGRLNLVHVLGELDIGNYAEVSDAIERIADDGDDPIIIAFVECTYIDTSGLTVLVQAHRKYGNRLRVVVPPDSKIRRIFEVTGLHRALLLHDDFRVAIA